FRCPASNCPASPASPWARAIPPISPRSREPHPPVRPAPDCCRSRRRRRAADPMDANGTRYQLLLGEHDWTGCSLESGGVLQELWSASPPADVPVRWDPQRSELTLL